MKLNLSVIQDHLDLPFTAKISGAGSKSRLLDRPKLYLPGRKLEPEQLYVSKPDALPALPPCNGLTVICTEGKLPQAWLYSSAAVLSVEGQRDLVGLFQQVHEVFDKFQQWELELTQELTKDTDFDICNVIRLGLSVLDNPFSMMDATMRVVFSSEVTPAGITVTDCPYTLDMDQSLNIKNACRQERMIRTPYLSAVDMAGDRCYCFNLYPMGHFAGCAWISDSHRPFRDSDFSLADFFFSIFQRAYQKHLRSLTDTESPKITALRKLLKHKPVTQEELELFCLEDGEQWQCFKLRERDLAHSMPTDYMYATLCALLPGAVLATFLSGAIVGLLKFGKGDETMSLFQDLLHRMDYFCGVSNAFTDIRQLDAYVLQAEFVVSSFSGEEGNMRSFQESLLPFLLHQCQEKLPLAELESESIRILRQYDTQRGTEYLKTLEAYLRNEMSISRTSEALYIHRSSLLKRLDKILRLTGLDLENPDTRLYLRLFFRLQ